MNRQSPEDLEDSENAVSDTAVWVHVVTHMPKPTVCTTPTVNCNVDYRLGNYVVSM